MEYIFFKKVRFQLRHFDVNPLFSGMAMAVLVEEGVKFLSFIYTYIHFFFVVLKVIERLNFKIFMLKV